MNPSYRRPLISGLLILLPVIFVLIALTVLLGPQQTHPAFAVAVDFTNAVATDDHDRAVSLMSADLLAFATDNCPEGVVSACIRDYIPAEWGAFQSAIFRRAVPNGDAWDVLLIATYELGQGFSGVCIYNRVEPTTEEGWQVTRWSGFISCDEANAGLDALASDPDAPNHAP